MLPLEFWSYKRRLEEVLVDHETTVQWCKKNGLLSNHKGCLACSEQMQRNDGIDGSRLVYYIFKKINKSKYNNLPTIQRKKKKVLLIDHLLHISCFL